MEQPQTASAETTTMAPNIVGVSAGFVIGSIKAIVNLGLTLETAYYGAIGAIAGYFAIKGIEYLRKKLKKK